MIVPRTRFFSNLIIKKLFHLNIVYRNIASQQFESNRTGEDWQTRTARDSRTIAIVRDTGR